MLRLFSRNLFINSILLLPFIFLIRISGLLNPQTPINDINSLFFSDLHTTIGPIFAAILANFLIFFQAALINRLAIKNNYDRSLSLFPGLFYIIFVSIIPSYHTLSAALIGNTFVILGLLELSKLYKVHKPASTIFNVGFLSTLSVFIYLPNICFVLLGLIGLLSLRAQNLKEMLQYLAGIIIAGYITYGIYYSLGHHTKVINFLDFGFLDLNFAPDWNINQTIFYGILVVLFIVFRRKIIVKKAIHVVKKINFHYYLLILGMLSFFIGSNQYINQKWILLAIPLGTLLGLYAATVKNRIWFELVFWLLILFIADNTFNLRSMLIN